ncbi:MAG: type III-A CRISPR-associated RAMP protein Csm4 [Chlorobi bacterium]|nr:type III-A CRISPR-associated RAMP protein Csm4 [Chlorobiota bacterium]
MKINKTFHIFPKAPLYVGGRSTEDLTHPDGIIRSDTLASAIANALVSIGRLQSSDVKDFMDNVAFSSAFPLVKVKQESIYFFPKPAGFVLSRDIRERKKVKKARWFEKSIIENILTGQEIDLADVELDGQFVFSRSMKDRLGNSVKISRLFAEQEHARAQVARIPSDDSHPFFAVTKVFKAKDSIKAGLFFIAVGDDKYVDLVTEGLEILQDTGFGSDRTVGWGHFEFEEADDSALPTGAGNGDKAYSLGLYIPEGKEALQDLKPLHYDLIERKGWVTVSGYLNVRRNGLFMFTEGSMFRINRNVYMAYFEEGTVRDVTPPFPKGMPEIYRSGKTIFICAK